MQAKKKGDFDGRNKNLKRNNGKGEICFFFITVKQITFSFFLHKYSQAKANQYSEAYYFN